MKRNNKMIYIIVSLILLIIILLLCIVLPSKKEKITLSDLQKMEKETKTGLIYVYSSKKEECSNCSSIQRYLDRSKLNYTIYDKNKIEQKEYEEFLRYMHIDKKNFNLPALIYIKNGQKQSYLMNIKNENIVKEYIENYELKKIKE